MSAFWRGWFGVLALSILMFGVILGLGAFAATDGPTLFLLGLLGGGEITALAPETRFSLAVLGAVSIGWAVMLHLVISAAITLGPAGRPLWRAVSAGIWTWFVVDSTLSVLTGFGLNVIPNLLLLGMCVIGLRGSGVLRGGEMRA